MYEIWEWYKGEVLASIVSSYPCPFGSYYHRMRNKVLSIKLQNKLDIQFIMSIMKWLTIAYLGSGCKYWTKLADDCCIS